MQVININGITAVYIILITGVILHLLCHVQAIINTHRCDTATASQNAIIGACRCMHYSVGIITMGLGVKLLLLHVLIITRVLL